MLPLHAVSLLLSLAVSVCLCLSVFLPHSYLHDLRNLVSWDCVRMRNIHRYVYIHSTTVPHTVQPQLCVCVCCSGNKNVELSMRQSDSITSRWNWWCFVIIITLSTNFKRDTDTLIHSLTHWFQFTSMNWHKDSKQCCLSVCALFSKLQVDRWQNFILFKWCHHKIDDTADIVIITDTNCFNCTMKFS